MVGTKLLSCYFALFVLTCQYFAGGSHVGREETHAGGDRGPNCYSHHVPGTRYLAYLMLELFLTWLVP